MTHSKSPPRPVVVHRCSACGQPQTKIQRKLGEDRYGSTTFVCTRPECPARINMAQVETWTVV